RVDVEPLVYAIARGDGDARAEGVRAADFEPVVLHNVEFIGERIDRGIPKPLVVVPAEATLIERNRAGEEHRELSADDRARMPFGGGIARQRDAVAVQPD